MKSLLIKYYRITDPNLLKSGGVPGYEYDIPLTDERPIYQPMRKIPTALLQQYKEELDRYENLGVISRVLATSWSFPVHLAVKWPNKNEKGPETGRKQDEDATRIARPKMRFTIDARALNRVTCAQQFILPRLDDLKWRLKRKQIFSKIDLKDGFFNVRVSERTASIHSFQTPWGNYRLNRLCQGGKIVGLFSRVS